MRSKLPSHHLADIQHRRFPDSDDQLLPGLGHGRQGGLPVAYAPDIIHDTTPLHTATDVGSRRSMECLPDKRQCSNDRGGNLPVDSNKANKLNTGTGCACGGSPLTLSRR